VQAARESAAPACEMVEYSGDEGARRPVRLTESREIAFIIALAMEAALPRTSEYARNRL